MKFKSKNNILIHNSIQIISMLNKKKEIKKYG
jgi:hypothetical protein